MSSGSYLPDSVRRLGCEGIQGPDEERRDNPVDKEGIAAGINDRNHIAYYTLMEPKEFCKERALNEGRNASMVDIYIALQAYEKVKRLQETTEKDNPEVQDA
ncbi:hypothetical protein NDU88_004062 [Pleurodeles waltl]|uniref:Uncharacterized protein n=1 Tax=Pleurodeles waltl TaxID=8319 RepID=A0AAV7QDG5_PLEWA|nr:hypothetical protein NDU88_004062 [Pleurodeles waltl]